MIGSMRVLLLVAVTVAPLAAQAVPGLPSSAAGAAPNEAVLSDAEIAARKVLEEYGDGEGSDHGLRLLRRALREAGDGQTDVALELLDAARVELPGSPLVAHAKGDLHAAREEWDAALDEYARGARDGYEFRSAFNSGVVQHRRSEATLRADAVQALGEDIWGDRALVPATLPDGPQPGLLKAVEAAIQRHRGARLSFLRALDERFDDAARESVAALNERLDELQAMRDELLERQQDQDGEDEQEGEDGEPDDEQQQDENEDEQEQQDDEQQDGDQGQDDEPQDQQQPEQDEGEDEQDAPPPNEGQGEVAPANLTPQQMSELLDKLEELEEVALKLQRIQRENERRGVEKDW